MSVQVIVNGLPGNMAKEVIQAAMDRGLEVLPWSLTGPGINEEKIQVGDLLIQLISPENANAFLKTFRNDYPNALAVDYTHPTAVNQNAELYVQNQLSFVMGTTGGDRNALLELCSKAELPCVIAPNMAKPIVAFQDMMQETAKRFQNAFEGYSLKVQESHQAGKADTSGTAKAVVQSFQKLGLQFEESEIQKERDSQKQLSEWNIPEEHLTGHAFHTYTMQSPEGSTVLEFRHNVLGRRIYAEGTVDALLYLSNKIKEGKEKKVFDMIDVLRGL